MKWGFQRFVNLFPQTWLGLLEMGELADKMPGRQDWLVARKEEQTNLEDLLERLSELHLTQYESPYVSDENQDSEDSEDSENYVPGWKPWMSPSGRVDLGKWKVLK